MTPADDQGQNGTNGTNNGMGSTGGMGIGSAGGMEPSTPAMGASNVAADPTAGGIGINDASTRLAPDVSESSAGTQGGALASTGSMGSNGASGGEGRLSAVKDQATKLRGQATDRARTAAEQGKTRATETIDGLAQVVHQTAGNLEQQVNPEIAKYIHRAADALDSFSASLRDKSVDEIVEDATQFARRNPAVAIGAAVAIGFALSRFLKATSSPTAGTSTSAYALDDDDDMPSMTTTRGVDTQPRYNA